MQRYALAGFVCLFLILTTQIKGSLSLRCRTGNAQSDDQFQRVMQDCRRRTYGFYGSSYDSDSRTGDYATDSQESSDDSDEDPFDNKFLSYGSGNRNNANNAYYGNRNNGYGNSMNNRFNSSRNNMARGRNSWPRQSNRYDSSNYDQSYGNHRRMNGRFGNAGMAMDPRSSSYSDSHNAPARYGNDMTNYQTSRGNGPANYRDSSGNMQGNNGPDRNTDQSCVVQCFFNELNLVDQRGFPERSLVINMMTQNVQDPELRDFIEESIVECYHYIVNNGRQDKCRFSQNLLTCLAEKGREMCEDWDDE
ncbi:hypothetical protein TKK_0009394 [Trichogramma kaykai]|uniref:Uncharacterized protein n=1 Tax=Trichogramma kaykai TaxID=54128 RepID=A0ABD2WZ90_9HYME